MVRCVFLHRMLRIQYLVLFFSSFRFLWFLLAVYFYALSTTIVYLVWVYVLTAVRET